MNPLIILIVLVVAAFLWHLTRGLRAGEFKFGDGSYGRTTAHIRRGENPAVFWAYVALEAGLILYVASFVLEM